MFCCAILCVFSSLSIIFMGKRKRERERERERERAGCFFCLSGSCGCYCSVALIYCAEGWFAMCACSISWSFSLTFLGLSITNDTVSSANYNTWDGFNFEKVNFLSLDGGVPCFPSYGVYIFHNLFFFARVCSNVSDFNNRNQFVTAKLQSYKIINIIIVLKHFLVIPQSLRVDC